MAGRAAPGSSGGASWKGASLPAGVDDGAGALKMHLVAALSDTTTRGVDGLLGSKSADTPYFCPSCDLPVLIYGIAVRPPPRVFVRRPRDGKC